MDDNEERGQEFRVKKWIALNEALYRLLFINIYALKAFSVSVFFLIFMVSLNDQMEAENGVWSLLLLCYVHCMTFLSTLLLLFHFYFYFVLSRIFVYLLRELLQRREVLHLLGIFLPACIKWVVPNVHTTPLIHANKNN